MSENLPAKNQETSPILAAALNPDLDIAKMEKLYELHERAMQREALIKYNEAMSKVQQEITPIQKTKTNKDNGAKYAPLEAVVKSVMPIYSKHGFALSFKTLDSKHENHILIECEVSHSSGYIKTYPYDAPIDNAGIRGSINKTPTHAKGSTTSYARRYMIAMIFNLAFADEDNDGNGEFVNKKQEAELVKLIEQTGANMHRFLNFYDIESVNKLPSSWFGAAVNMLKMKRNKTSEDEPNRDKLWYESKIDSLESGYQAYWDKEKKQAIQDLSPEEFGSIERMVKQYNEMEKEKASE
jgi:hypothetical protein